MARSQLLGIGVSDTMLADRMKRGLLVRLHRGVYAVGHARLRREGWWLAAVLAVGPGAALSHRDAAGLHALRPANHERIDVTTTRRGRASTDRVAVHRAALDPLDVTVLDGIPVTTIARTLVDLAGILPRHQLAKALSVAEVNGVLDVCGIEATLARTTGRHGNGHAAMLAALAAQADRGPTITRSELEDRFVALLDDHGFPPARMNAPVEGFEVDALWAERRLVVELDGYRFHRDKHSFQRDRDKANALLAAGFQVFRFTYDDVINRPRHVTGQLAPLLSP